MFLTFIINGQDTKVRCKKDIVLFDAIKKALKKAKAVARPVTDWELRDTQGVLLERNRPANELGIENFARFFLSPAVGGGGIRLGDLNIHGTKTGRFRSDVANRSNTPQHDKFVPQRHNHICMSCGEKWDCPNFDHCKAKVYCLPQVILWGPKGPEIFDHICQRQKPKDNVFGEPIDLRKIQSRIAEVRTELHRLEQAVLGDPMKTVSIPQKGML